MPITTMSLTAAVAALIVLAGQTGGMPVTPTGSSAAVTCPSTHDLSSSSWADLLDSQRFSITSHHNHHFRRYSYLKGVKGLIDLFFYFNCYNVKVKVKNFGKIMRKGRIACVKVTTIFNFNSIIEAEILLRARFFRSLFSEYSDFFLPQNCFYIENIPNQEGNLNKNLLFLAPEKVTLPVLSHLYKPILEILPK